MRKKGFTLIELMVVIAILAILAAIALTSYKSYMRKARAKELVTIARNCAQEALVICETQGSLPNSIDSCPNPAYLPGGVTASLTSSPSCGGDFDVTYEASFDSTTCTVTCSYNSTKDLLTCTQPQCTTSSSS